MDTTRLKPEVQEYLQQLVGGNSNPVAKLQAVVPGLFAETGAFGKSPRRLVDIGLRQEQSSGEKLLSIRTLSKAGYEDFVYKKVNGQYVAIHLISNNNYCEYPVVA